MSVDAVVVVTGLLVVVPCALLGCLLLLRQLVMMGDAISHAALPGIVAAFFLTESLGPLVAVAGAAVVGMLTVGLVEALRGAVREDAAIGVVFTALFAAGVVLIARYGGNVHLDLAHVLYGEISFAPLNVVTVGGTILGPRSFWTLGPVALLVVGFVAVLWKELKVATFDPALAAAVGLSPAVAHHLLMGVVSTTVVGAFDSVGAILVVAFLAAPAATAYLLTERLGVMMAVAVGAGAVATVFGHAVAARLDVSVSGAMAVAAGVLFLLALLLSPSHGLVGTALRRRRADRRLAEDLLLSRLAALGGAADGGRLAATLAWEGGQLRAVLDRASRAGLVTTARGGVALTAGGRERATRVEAALAGVPA